jgi:hypothetical protein
LNDLRDQITGSERMLKWLHTSCQEEEAKVNQLKWEKIRIKKLLKGFKENNEEYLKIKDTVEQEITRLLLEGTQLLRVALYSLMGSMRKDPEKYSSLIYYGHKNNSSYGDYYHTSYPTNRKNLHQFNSNDSFFKALKLVLLEDADKLYEQLLKEQVDTIISRYTSDKNSSLLPTTIVTRLSGVRFEG